MIAWMIAAFFFVVCLALSWRVLQLEEDLHCARALCKQAEKREEQLAKACDCSIEINHELAKRRPMYFAGQPTLDATAYRAERQPLIVWWTYDN